MLDLFKQIDFSRQIEQSRDLKVFILQACKKIEQEETDNLRKIRKPQLDDELLNQFIISGIPLLKPDNEEKFLGLFRTKILDAKKIGEKNGLLGIEVGREGAVGNQTLYMTYKSAVEAKAAFSKLNNLKFDKNHTLQCFSINEIRGFIEEEDKDRPFSEPRLPPLNERIAHNLDEQMRGQFLLREGNAISLNWLDHLDKSSQNALEESLPVELVVNRAVFSPLGTYLAVCCADGVRVYSGGQLSFKGLLRQTNPVDVKFSPDERFLVSSNGGLAKNRENFILWALQEEVKLKAFKAHSQQSLENFQFSQDSQQLSFSREGEVVFLPLGSMEELKRWLRAAEEEQHILKVAHVQKLAWLRGAFWKNWVIVVCYEVDYNPNNVAATRVFLYNTETRTERKWRAWSEHARSGEVFVSERGDWVAVSMRKFIKKNHFATAIQIGNLLKREELEITSLEVREEVGNIAWDWHNNRFAVIHEDEDTKKGINVRYAVSFYEISTKNKSIEYAKLGEIKDNLQNRVVLASNGNFFALYNITEQSPEKGKFSLGMITRETVKGKRNYNFEFTRQNMIVNGMNFFQVDASGRFVLLGTEKGYQIWNFIGESVTKDTLQKNIHDVQWRPRIFNQLPEAEERALINQEKEVRKKYEEMDDRRINALKYQKEEAKQKQKAAFLSFVEKKQQWFRQFAERRQSQLGFKEFEARTDRYEVEEGFIDLQ